jgi:hypothetical protein
MVQRSRVAVAELGPGTALGGMACRRPLLTALPPAFERSAITCPRLNASMLASQTSIPVVSPQRTNQAARVPFRVILMSGSWHQARLKKLQLAHC